jgi:hypothetical protein
MAGSLIAVLVLAMLAFFRRYADPIDSHTNKVDEATVPRNAKVSVRLWLSGCPQSLRFSGRNGSGFLEFEADLFTPFGL